MRAFRLSVAVATTALFAGTTLLAQAQSSSSSSSATASGSIVSSSSSSISDADRMKRTEGLWSLVLQAKTIDKQYRSALDVFQAKRLAIRQQCRSDLRKANRDQKITVSIKCFRNEMAEERDMLKKQLAFAEIMPGLTRPSRTVLTTNVQALLDAASSIVQGVDSGVFTTVEQVMEAKKNLGERYRIKAQEAWTFARAEQALTLTSFVLTELEHADAVDRTKDSWTTAVSCLEQVESRLMHLLKQDTPSLTEVRSTMNDANACMPTVSTALKAQKSSSSKSSSSN